MVVSDASTLINLARVNQFGLLATFYSHIVIPEAVYEEVVVRGEGRIVSLRQVLDLLRARGTWIEQELFDEVLQIVDE